VPFIVIGYLRVSTADQDLEKNKARDLAAGQSARTGQGAGKVSRRERKIGEVLESLKPNDAIVVSELSRLGRSMLECIEILSVATQKRISVYAVKGPGA
jgi:DNA invertase Pin-like site-specific DNA recombinase